MNNVTSEVKGDKLILTVDIGSASRKSARPSASGKTKVLASTNGFQVLVDGVSVSLNVTVK